MHPNDCVLSHHKVSFLAMVIPVLTRDKKSLQIAASKCELQYRHWALSRLVMFEPLIVEPHSYTLIQRLYTKNIKATRPVKSCTTCYPVK